MTELVAFFSALLKTYPNLMGPLNSHSSEDLTHLVIQTHEELSQGRPINTPERFLSCVREDVPEDEWRLAIHCTRTWGPTSDFDPDLTEDSEMERMTMGLLWLSALITELQRREPQMVHVEGPIPPSVDAVQ